MADLKFSRALLEQASGLTGSTAADLESEALHQQAVSLGANLELLTTILSENISVLQDNEVGTKAKNTVKDKSLTDLVQSLYSRDTKFNNEQGKRLVAAVDYITTATNGMTADLTVTV